MTSPAIIINESKIATLLFIILKTCLLINVFFSCLFAFFTLHWHSISLKQPYVREIVYAQQIVPTANLCTSTSCKISDNCYCASKKIPGNIPLAQTPQFFSFTFNDSVHEFTAYSLKTKLDYWMKNDALKDKNGCQIKPTILSMNHFSDFSFISYLEKIGEISIHSDTHTSSFTSSYRKWKNELTTCYNDIIELAQVKPKGARAPYLETNDAYFNVLKELGLSYDTSAAYFARSYNPGKTAAQVNCWPFTLDFLYPEESIGYSSAMVLKERHPGIWQVPMIGFQYKNGTEYEIMDYTISKTFVADFKRDFESNYKSNRAPLGLYFHSYYFMDEDETLEETTKLAKITELLQFVMSHENVLYATPQRIINWMKNPKPFAETKKMAEFQCPDAKLFASNPCKEGVFKKDCKMKNLLWYNCQDLCEDGTYTFNICGDQCPNTLPDLNVAWTYDSGKKRTYPAPVEYFDSVIPESNAKYPHFTGSVTIEEPFEGTYNPSTGLFGKNGRFCSKIVLENKNEFKGVNGFILTIDGFPSTSKMTSIDGYQTTGISGGFRMIGKNVQIMRFTSATVGKLCMNVNVNGANTFKLSNLKTGVDFYEQTLSCELGGSTTPCSVFCGNKKQDAGETKANCPVDFK